VYRRSFPRFESSVPASRRVHFGRKPADSESVRSHRVSLTSSALFVFTGARETRIRRQTQGAKPDIETRVSLQTPGKTRASTHQQHADDLVRQLVVDLLPQENDPLAVEAVVDIYPVRARRPRYSVRHLWRFSDTAKEREMSRAVSWVGRLDATDLGCGTNTSAQGAARSPGPSSRHSHTFSVFSFRRETHEVPRLKPQTQRRTLKIQRTNRGSAVEKHGSACSPGQYSGVIQVCMYHHSQMRGVTTVEEIAMFTPCG